LVWRDVDSQVELQLQGHPATYSRWSLNGRAAPISGELKETNTGNRRAAGCKVSLEGAWNEVRFRAYGTGYSPFRAGAIVSGPAEKLWYL